MQTALEKLIADLSVLAVENPDAPVSFQLSDGTPHVVDPEIEPYFYRGAIVLPIVEDTDDDEDYGPPVVDRRSPSERDIDARTAAQLRVS